MLDRFGTLNTHAGLLTAGAGKSFTVAASTDNLTSNGHGYSNGTVVVITALTGGTGLKTQHAYYVVSTATNTFQLSETSGGAAIDVTLDGSAGTVKSLVEISGGSPAYARKAIAYAAAALGVLDDSTNGATFDIPAGGVIDYSGYYSASTAGTLYAIAAQTQETSAGQGTYTLTDVKHDMNFLDV